jgi:small nuclear ribonucleoprotein (snRNP)-like protein
LFDVDAKRARAILREGTELIADLRSVQKQPNIVEK